MEFFKSLLQQNVTNMNYLFEIRLAVAYKEMVI